MKRKFINTRIVVDIATDRILSREGFEYEGPTAEAVAATAISKLWEAHGAGGKLEAWTFTLDPGSIAAAAQEIDTIAITGARAGDPCWVEFEAPDANVITGGAKVTANDVVSVYLSNNITVTTATDSAAKVGNLLILKRAIGS